MLSQQACQQHGSAPLQQQHQQRPRCLLHKRTLQTIVPCQVVQQQQQQHRLLQRIAASNQNNTQAQQSMDLEMAVPEDQRPVNELAALKQAWLYSWAVLPLGDYVKRLALVFGFFFAFVGAPIADQTFDLSKTPLEFVLSAGIGSSLVVAIAMVRIYLGWSYVGDRLLSAAVPYEETGWYDGQTFVKPPEVLTRDRLLATYEVRPTLAKLRSTLLGMGGILLVTALLLLGLIKAGTDADGVYGRGSMPVPRQVTADGVLYGKRVKDLRELADNDELAAEEAAAQGGVPGYCGDRLLRAYAGGQYCSKFDN